VFFKAVGLAQIMKGGTPKVKKCEGTGMVAGGGVTVRNLWVTSMLVCGAMVRGCGLWKGVSSFLWEENDGAEGHVSQGEEA